MVVELLGAGWEGDIRGGIIPGGGAPGAPGMGNGGGIEPGRPEQ